MAVQAYPYLVMTDGTLTATFADGNGAQSDYPPVRDTWPIAITARRRAALGRGPWADVVEEWTLNIRGADAATALSNLETLVRLLDQADRFWRLGEAVSPVLLKYTPQGSTIFTTANPSQCMVMGRAPGDESNLSLPPTFNNVGMYYEILGVRVRFLRTGQWLNPTPETTTITSNANNPTVQGANFASNLSISSPMKLTCNFSVGGAFGNAIATAPGVILTATTTARLQIYEAEAGVLGTNVASQADAAGKARGGSVARYSPGVLATSIVIDVAAGSFDQNCRRIALWAPVRNNSATTNFTIQASALWQNIDTTVGPIVPIDTSSLNPRLLFLGILSTRVPIQKIRLTPTASAASGTLDIDYLVIQAIDDECSGTVAIYGAGANISTTTAMTPPGNDPTIIDPRPLSETTPLLLQSGQSNLLSAAGDGYLMSKGQGYVATWLGTSGAFWRTVNGANALVDTAFTASRYNGYLSPR